MSNTKQITHFSYYFPNNLNPKTVVVNLIIKPENEGLNNVLSHLSKVNINSRLQIQKLKINESYQYREFLDYTPIVKGVIQEIIDLQTFDKLPYSDVTWECNLLRCLKCLDMNWQV